MNKITAFCAMALTSSLILGCTNSVNPSNAPLVSKEGMPLVKSTDSTVAYKKIDVDFSSYKNIIILPSQVAFKKNWKRNYNHGQLSGSQRLNDEDVLTIKKKVSSLFDDVFKREMIEVSDKKVIETPDKMTLILKPFIVNLDLNDPDINKASNVRTYNKETGEATLYLEIFDSESGEILARVIDDAIIGDDTYVHWSNRARNNADAIRAIRKWVKRLNVQFDKALNE